MELTQSSPSQLRPCLWLCRCSHGLACALSRQDSSRILQQYACQTKAHQKVLFSAALLASAALTVQSRQNVHRRTGPDRRPRQRTRNHSIDTAEESPVVEAEARLEEAVRNEDFLEAARLRDEISAMSLDGEVAILSVNREFFAAMRSRDLERMKAVWQTGNHACCMHAKERPIHGFEPIVESWRKLFQKGRSTMDGESRQSVVLRGTVGRVVAVDEQANVVMTNMFERTSDGWKLWSHQAGPLRPPDAKPKMSFLERLVPRKLRELISQARAWRAHRRFQQQPEERQLQLSRALFSV
eukprot:TRINITY_DN59195_c0_g1_i1.p1 TRINITY_DN59195_c0_g1~~TRINITY_DN59195_c0_g1_i1.p1  ORF type:complete len:298 (-),score=46.06 TRINITY_DN59195_c0_g1_i1:13-906(-)